MVRGIYYIKQSLKAVKFNFAAHWNVRFAAQLDGIFGATLCHARTVCNDTDLTDAIRKLVLLSDRVGAVCNGAFILAASGILEDRCAVTHWQACDDLAATYPSIDVVPDPIFIKDETVWTSAGVTAGLDMSLAMIAEDLGKPAALSLARSLVAYMVRPGGQSQFSEVLRLQTADGQAPL